MDPSVSITSCGANSMQQEPTSKYSPSGGVIEVVLPSSTIMALVPIALFARGSASTPFLSRDRRVWIGDTGKCVRTESCPWVPLLTAIVQGECGLVALQPAEGSRVVTSLPPVGRIVTDTRHTGPRFPASSLFIGPSAAVYEDICLAFAHCTKSSLFQPAAWMLVTQEDHFHSLTSTPTTTSTTADGSDPSPSPSPLSLAQHPSAVAAHTQQHQQEYGQRQGQEDTAAQVAVEVPQLQPGPLAALPSPPLQHVTGAGLVSPEGRMGHTTTDADGRMRSPDRLEGTPAHLVDDAQSAASSSSSRHTSTHSHTPPHTQAHTRTHTRTHEKEPAERGKGESKEKGRGGRDLSSPTPSRRERERDTGRGRSRSRSRDRGDRRRDHSTRTPTPTQDHDDSEVRRVLEDLRKRYPRHLNLCNAVAIGCNEKHCKDSCKRSPLGDRGFFPTMCKYGAKCRVMSNCPFYHPEDVPRLDRHLPPDKQLLLRAILKHVSSRN